MDNLKTCYQPISSNVQITIEHEAIGNDEQLWAMASPSNDKHTAKAKYPWSQYSYKRSLNNVNIHTQKEVRDTKSNVYISKFYCSLPLDVFIKQYKVCKRKRKDDKDT